MTLSSTERRLRSALKGEVRSREPLAKHTTYRIGGPADLFVTCDTVADLAEAVRICEEDGVDRTVIGKGSNLLVADSGYRGAILDATSRPGRRVRSRTWCGTRTRAVWAVWSSLWVSRVRSAEPSR
jgi:UDP-N-acetylmuramate dehydrogenase